MKKIVKRYSNDELTVIWQPDKCIHSKKCFHGLPAVFNPENSPWIQVEHADNEKIIDQVRACPSGALSLETQGDSSTESANEVCIEVLANGPLLVTGIIVVKGKDGSEQIKRQSTALCRCGASQNKPYCDGSHTQIGFKDE